MTAGLREPRPSIYPFGAPDRRTAFTSDHIAIERLDGTVVAERPHPRTSFVGHDRTTPWKPLDRAYFNGYALWGYLTMPFCLAWPGVEVREVEPWREGDEVWRVLRGPFSAHLSAPSAVVDFFFCSGDLLFWRHHYAVEIIVGDPAAPPVFDHHLAD